MNYELTGTLFKKFDEIQRTPTFKIREFVVENNKDVNGNVITNYIKFQCTQDRTALINQFNEGEQIRVLFNIRGSKWERDGKTSYFNNLDAWKVEHVLGTGQSDQPDDIPGDEDLSTPDTGNGDDDLPF